MCSTESIEKSTIVARTKIVLIFSSNNKSGGEWLLTFVVLLKVPLRKYLNLPSFSELTFISMHITSG